MDHMSTSETPSRRSRREAQAPGTQATARTKRPVALVLLGAMASKYRWWVVASLTALILIPMAAIGVRTHLGNLARERGPSPLDFVTEGPLAPADNLDEIAVWSENRVVFDVSESQGFTDPVIGTSCRLAGARRPQIFVLRIITGGTVIKGKVARHAEPVDRVLASRRESVWCAPTRSVTVRFASGLEPARLRLRQACAVAPRCRSVQLRRLRCASGCARRSFVPSNPGLHRC